MFVIKFDPQGNVAFAIFVGGSGRDYPGGIALDASDNIWLTGYTDSNDFPVTSNAIQSSFQGSDFDAFIVELNASGTKLLFGTYLGGNGSDQGFGIAVDGRGDITVGGTTNSTNFPTFDAMQSKGGGTLGFITKIDSVGKLQFSTYFGVQVTSLAADSAGDIYVSGTAVAGFPLLNPIPNQVDSLTVAKLNPAGSALLYSTNFGLLPSVLLSPFGLQVDSQGNAYFSGLNGGDFKDIISLVNAIQSDPTSYFLATLDPNGNLIFSSYFAAGVTGIFAPSNMPISLDSKGNIYAAAMVPIWDVAPLLDPINGAFDIFFQTQSPDSSVEPFIAKVTPGPGASFAMPASIPFSPTQVGNSLGTRVTLFNTGTTDIDINAVTTTGDFSKVNECPATLTAGNSCTVTVSFVPTAGGSRPGSLVIADDSPGNPHVIQLSGTGLAPGLSLSPTSLTFSSQDVSTTSSAQKVTLTNTGTGALRISRVTTTGDFAETNNCGASLTPGACTISVTFTPTASGQRTGTLTITDAIGVQTVSVTGTGAAGLALSVESGATNSATVTAGTTAHYQLRIGGGGMSGTATLTCTGAPAGATCTVPASEPLNATTATTFQVSVTTATRSNALLHKLGSQSEWMWALLLPGIVLLPAWSRDRRSALRRLSGAFFIALLLLLSGCGGNGSMGNSLSTGTPAGTYSLTVSATLSGITESTNLTLVVK
jgi:hypothetical protein